ncbi:hypothetical protein ACPXB3_18550 [Gordonia sp. DT219]|uniref:hypothetical protein n=1 Tax=Gordonia sp. DT219 TaxID=3416658 RepID=UPI003CFA8EA2
MKRLPAVVAALLGTVAIATSCSSQDSAPASKVAATSLVTTSMSVAACPPPGGATAGTDGAIAEAVGAASLPSGTSLVNVQSVANIDDRSKSDVVVRVCSPGTFGNQLKDLGTVIARSIKQSPAGDSVASLRVTNTAEEGNPQGKIRCEDFAIRTFSADALNGALRAAWKYPSES